MIGSAGNWRIALLIEPLMCRIFILVLRMRLPENDRNIVRELFNQFGNNKLNNFLFSLAVYLFLDNFLLFCISLLCDVKWGLEYWDIMRTLSLWWITLAIIGQLVIRKYLNWVLILTNGEMIAIIFPFAILNCML